MVTIERLQLTVFHWNCYYSVTPILGRQRCLVFIQVDDNDLGPQSLSYIRHHRFFTNLCIIEKCISFSIIFLSPIRVRPHLTRCDNASVPVYILY